MRLERLYSVLVEDTANVLVTTKCEDAVATSSRVYVNASVLDRCPDLVISPDLTVHQAAQRWPRGYWQYIGADRGNVDSTFT